MTLNGRGREKTCMTTWIWPYESDIIWSWSASSRPHQIYDPIPPCSHWSHCMLSIAAPQLVSPSEKGKRLTPLDWDILSHGMPMPASWSESHPPTEIGGEKSAHDPNQKKKHPKRGDGEPAIPIMLLTVSLSYAVSRLNSKFIQYMHAK